VRGSVCLCVSVPVCVCLFLYLSISLSLLPCASPCVGVRVRVYVVSENGVAFSFVCFSGFCCDMCTVYFVLCCVRMYRVFRCVCLCVFVRAPVRACMFL